MSGTPEGAGSFGFTALIFVKAQDKGLSGPGEVYPTGTERGNLTLPHASTEVQVPIGPDGILLWNGLQKTLVSVPLMGLRGDLKQLVSHPGPPGFEMHCRAGMYELGCQHWKGPWG